MCNTTLQDAQAMPGAAGVADRRSRSDRREATDRRSGERRQASDRRSGLDTAAQLAELEMRVAVALRQCADSIEGDGSGWDKIIVPLR